MKDNELNEFERPPWVSWATYYELLQNDVVGKCPACIEPVHKSDIDKNGIFTCRHCGEVVDTNPKK